MSSGFDDTKWYSYTSSTQTMRTWARILESFEEVPPEFQSAFPDYADPFPYTLHIPEERFALFQKRNKKLICLFTDRFVFMESARNVIETHSILFTDVLYIERGKILLNSWLNIITVSDLLSIRFNTTNDYLLQPVIDKIRQGMSSPFANGSSPEVEQESNPELAKFDFLNTVNYKYMNYGKKSVRLDDSVLGVFYQPERCIRELNLFNKTVYKRNSTDHLTILTEQELILIKEEKKSKTEKESFYGGVFTYIPRRNIDSISFVPGAENAHCIMEIRLDKNTRLASEFSLENGELNQLKAFLT